MAERCNLVMDEIEVVMPGRESLYRSALDEAFAGASPREPLLFLSGGSQHGAFGAGYLDEWSRSPGGLPPFRLVTGVSAGALQSTAAFIGDTDMLLETAEISGEGRILDAFVPGRSVRDGFTLGSLWSLARRGAVSDLVPLRERMQERLTDDVLARVAEGYAGNRRLFVGVTDVDTGRAAAVDLTELAHRYTQDPVGNAHLKTCYHEVLIASSVVPIAAKPVFLDGRMYIDGGVRFAVFAEDIRKRLPDLPDLPPSPPPPGDGPVITPVSRKAPYVHIVLNGDGEPSTRCGKADDADCLDGRTPRPGHEDAPHESWDIADLAARSVSLLTNQVARLSVERAVKLEGREEGDVAFARIDEAEKDAHMMHPDALRFAALRPDDGLGARSCAEWRKIDEAVDDPVEFHPRYMHCLVSYGRTLAKARFNP